MLLLHACSYIAAAVAFVFCTLSLASGLLYIAEVIEEHTKLAKLIGQRMIYSVIAFHLLLLAFDQLPWHLIVLGVLCHVTYHTNLSSSTWPYISLTSFKFLASCVLVLVDHFAWFFYFAERAKSIDDTLASRYRHGRTPYRPAWDSSASKSKAHEPLSFMDVATFFGICVWLVPFFLFLSLSANDNVLPQQTGQIGTPALGSSARETAQTKGLYVATPARSAGRISILKSVLINPLLSLVPNIRGRNNSSRSQREGLIASPRISRPSSPKFWSHSRVNSGQFSPQIGSNFSPNLAGPPSPSPAAKFSSSTTGYLESPNASPQLGYGRPPPLRRANTAIGSPNMGSLGTFAETLAEDSTLDKPQDRTPGKGLRGSTSASSLRHSVNDTLRRPVSGTFREEESSSDKKDDKRD